MEISLFYNVKKFLFIKTLLNISKGVSNISLESLSKVKEDDVQSNLPIMESGDRLKAEALIRNYIQTSSSHNSNPDHSSRSNNDYKGMFLIRNSSTFKDEYVVSLWIGSRVGKYITLTIVMSFRLGKKCNIFLLGKSGSKKCGKKTRALIFIKLGTNKNDLNKCCSNVLI